MMAMARVIARQREHRREVADSPTHRPAKMLAITSTNPSAEHSSTFPGRQ